MKKIFFLSVLLAGTLLLSACNDNSANIDGSNTDNYKLSTPKITCANGNIYWDEIKNADKYEVSVNDVIAISYVCSYELPLSTDSKNFEVKVKAVSEDYKDSDFSKELSFTAKIILPIDSVSVEIMNNDSKVSISWPATNCTEYIVSINDKQFSAKSTTFLTASDEYAAGKNSVSVQPKGSKYDRISTPTTVTVEKSYPLNDVNDIRIEDGKLFYGENNVYDTSFIPAGENYTFTLSNIEEGKIKSDGPSFTAYKLTQPEITGAQNGFAINVSYHYVEIEGIAPKDCDMVFIEIFSSDFISIDSAIYGGFSSKRDFSITFDVTDSIYYPHYVQVTSKKEGALNSNIVTSSIS